MKVRIIFLSIATTLWSGFGVAESTIYSRTTDLPPLRVSYLDLQPVVDKAAVLIQQANAGSDTKTRIERIKINSISSELTISGHSFTADISRLPRKAHSFDFTFDIYGAAPVSEISISLRDYNRTLSVTGTSAEQVDAVFSALREGLEGISTPIGGSGLKVLVSYVLSVFFALFLLASLTHMVQKKTLEHWWVPVLSVGMFCLMFLSPVHEMFDGFLLVANDPSFLVRYGPELALVALIVGIISLLLPSFYSATSGVAPKGQLPNPPSQPKPDRATKYKR